MLTILLNQIRYSPKERNSMKQLVATLFLVACISTSAFGQEEGRYAVHTSGGSAKMQFNLGPTGIWATRPNTGGRRPKLTSSNFIVSRIEPGSPAIGFVKPNDVITGVNGTPSPEGIDPRATIAHAIIDAEAKDGKLNLQIIRRGTPMTVTVTLKKLPDYSPTWPYDCKRSETMLYNACDYMAGEQMPVGDVVADDGNIGPTQAGLMWLASGEPRYLQNAVRAAYWYAGQVEAGEYGWMEYPL